MESLTAKGHGVLPIVRPTTPLKANRRVIRWDVDFGRIDSAALEGLDAVIHLSGASLAGERWTPKYKAIIRESRIKSTSFLSSALAQLKNPPKVLLSASAVGFYGDSPLGEKKNETSPWGHDFLSEVCSSWEAATAPAEHHGIRVVHMRFGVVLSRKGGVLAKMLPIFQWGLGGKIGSGKQMISWIAGEEIPLAVSHVIQTPSLRGPVNFTSPEAVSNETLTKTLGHFLRRPTVFPLPSNIARFMFGEMADSLLLNSTNAFPKRLFESGYPFHYPTLEGALGKIFS